MTRGRYGSHDTSYFTSVRRVRRMIAQPPRGRTFAFQHGDFLWGFSVANFCIRQQTPSLFQQCYCTRRRHKRPRVPPANALKRLRPRLVSLGSFSGVAKKLTGLGLFPDVKCGADFAAFLRKQYEDYGVAIHETNVKVD
jgi:hypothetical protein